MMDKALSIVTYKLLEFFLMHWNNHYPPPLSMRNKGDKRRRDFWNFCTGVVVVA